MLRASHQDRSEMLGRGTDTLLQAKQHFEMLLDGNDHWCALRQVQRRVCDDRPVEAEEARALQEQLTRALASEPAFIAWQFIEAALACLALDSSLAGSAPIGEHAIGSSADQRQVSGSLHANEVPGLVNPKRLAARIPVLAPADSRDTAGLTTERPDDADSTRFTSAAIGIEEAQVKIVPRKKAATPLIDLALPPLPFTQSANPTEHRHKRAGGFDDTPIILQGNDDEADIAIIRPRPSPR